jgi:hypothetical protein
MVTKIDDVTRADLKDIITRGVAEKRTYTEIAKEIREKYSDMTADVPQRHIADRAELIAINELRMAAESAQYDEMVDMAAKGWDIVKMWSSTGDDRVSDGCQENTDAGWIPLEDEFPSGDQYSPRFPGCRCSLSFLILG